VALATSAAPTYFPPHAADGAVFVDGGLIANAPDLLLATLAMRLFAVELAGLKICSVGTAGGQPRAKPIGDPGTAT
jgi:patatin-like phospholipase/acyl hydrolase